MGNDLPARALEATTVSIPTNPLLTMVVILLMTAPLAAQEPVHIGSRLELLVDDFLIETMTGDARLQLHRPVRREIVFRTDAPWEGNASGYHSVFQDGDIYRVYYHGGHYLHSGPPAQELETHPWFLCYAESDDGINWRRPELGLFEFNGSTANNIILTPEAVAAVGGCPAHTAVFMDRNPACPPDERYKIVMYGTKPTGLYALKSADGVRFSLMSTEPLMTEGAFDSQNLAFWDPVREEYRLYHRGFKDGVRDILTATSPDFLSFPAPRWLEYPGAPKEHLYTNQIQPYYRAPHIFMGFPKRYTDRGWSEPMLALPGLEERLARAASHPRYGTAITDALFMTSRDGVTFKRWPEAFIRPGPRQRESWVYGDNLVFWGMLELPSHLEDAPNELSLYAADGYWEGVDAGFRRYTLRVDGFVSASASAAGGELIMRPLVFRGGNLALNAETSGAGSIRVEVQEADGTPIEGYTLEECPPIFCDTLRHIVRWEYEGGDLRALEGRPVRLRFVLTDADLYSFQFVRYEPEPERPDVVPLGALPRKDRDRGPFVVIDDDFQTAPAGTTPTEDDLNPAVAAEGQSGWEVREGAPDRVQVLDDEPVASGRPGERHYVKIERRAEGHHDGGALWLRLSPQDAADTRGGVMELSARILVPSTGRSIVDIDAYDGPVGMFARRAFHVRLSPTGQVTYYREQETPIPDLRLEPDVWQEVHIRADLQAGAFDLTVNGQTATDLPFAHDGVRRVQCLFFGPNTSNGTLYVDAVRVEVTP